MIFIVEGDEIQSIRIDGNYSEACETAKTLSKSRGRTWVREAVDKLPCILFFEGCSYVWQSVGGIPLGEEK